MNLSYGLLCEGDSDLSALSIIIQRLGERLGHDLIISLDQSNPVSGPISKVSVKLRTTAFLQANLDLGFYLADNDKGEIGKLQMIRTNVETVNQAWFNRSVIGIPDPHMEAWLIADQDTVKNYFGIPADQPLPFAGQQPKPRMSSLVSSYGEEQLTVGEFRRILASTMNIEHVIHHDSEFATFEGNIRAALNFVENQTGRA